MTTPAALRSRAEALAAPLPPLMAEAEQLARTMLLGAHGRRQSGMGDEFWQYRTAQAGDEAKTIDWRRSGRSDAHYVREKEWQGAQSVMMWVDRSASMRFASDKTLPQKARRAANLSLALAILLMKGGERVALASLGTPPRIGSLQLTRIAEGLLDPDEADYARPEIKGLLPHSRAVFISDFMGDLAAIEHEMAKAADRGVKGALMQVLDPLEEAFPFTGRTVFESLGGSLRHETLRAGDLRQRYLERLAERRDHLSRLARAGGWQFTTHHTDTPAQSALLWLFEALQGGR
ncbi:hypothetical protein AQS8620_02295 [Aquimixticola soesokkakensis]|uniref:DUF58 domain-containing protein n=1 Tax=Aquimixticola soesokkakensis TaxID=1519096 RepID=A0A1Y5T2M5_9RHOB|nr:DUF58 domain-containing protein [Aquimixticola soesokkakensis]SLN52401.1 hypothetical protein AQS8620_02295 [Aquimixticola soesokkakensis]